MKTGSLIGMSVFSLVAAAHLLRLVMGWHVSIEAWVVPMWVSAIGVMVPGYIAVLLWKESR